MTPQSLQAVRIDDLSGGMTDRYIEGKINQYEMADNCILRMYGGKGKLQSRNGGQVFNTSYYQIPSGDSRLVDLDDLDDQLFQFSARNIYYVTGAWNTLTGSTGNAALDVGTVSNYLSKAKWNKHLLVCNDAYARPVKVFKDSGGTFRVRTLGLPEIDTTGITITPSVVSTNSYIYAFVRRDEYTVGTSTFEEVSDVTYKTITNSSQPSVASNGFTGIPVLANGVTDNYNTASSVIDIFRTINNGTQFYKVGTITNGTTIFTDNMSDATLLLQEEIYTTGGVVGFTQVPLAKYIVVAGDKAFYLNIKEGSEVIGNRVRQAIPGSPYASPADFYVDLDEPILGGSAIDQNVIVFCENGKIYRLEGGYDEQGTGFLESREISRTITLCSNRSIVSTREGLFFAADSGFYFTDGFQVTRISDEIPESYSDVVSTATQKARIYGAYNAKEHRVEWATQRDSASNDNDAVFVCHLKWQNKPFTTWSGGEENTDNFQPTCLKYFNGNLLRGDRRGYLLEHKDNYLSDSKIDTTQAASLWKTTTIFPDFRWVSYDFGTTEFRKWVPEFIAMFDNQTNLSVLPQSNRDNSGLFNDLKEITYTSNFTWGDELFTWEGSRELAGFRWNYNTVIDAFRRFPAGDLRCNFKQIRLSPALVEIDSFDVLGTASSNTTTNILTLDDATKAFISDPIDYVIIFADDALSREYKVLSRPTATTLLLEDIDGTLTTGANREWTLKGYQKNQLFSLLSFEIRFTYIGRTQSAYKPDAQ